MYRRLTFVFAFALIAATLSSYVVYRMIVSNVQQPKAQAARVTTNKLVVATRNLAMGEMIQAGDVKVVDWAGPVPDHATGKVNDVVGRGTLTMIFKDEPIIDGRLAGNGAGAGLASTIPVGKRAVALRVNEVVGLAGFVLPGAHVDVVASGLAPGSELNTGTISRTILQNIEVLSAGQRIDRDANGKPESAQVVNLLVTPNQAEMLSLAGSETKVQLVLRNPLDSKEEATRGASVASLFGQSVLPRPVAATMAPPPPAMVNTAVKAPVDENPVVQIFTGRRSGTK